VTGLPNFLDGDDDNDRPLYVLFQTDKKKSVSSCLGMSLVTINFSIIADYCDASRFRKSTAEALRQSYSSGIKISGGS